MGLGGGVKGEGKRDRISRNIGQKQENVCVKQKGKQAGVN